MTQRRGRDVEGHGAAARDGIAAVLAAAEGRAGRADGALGDQGRHRGALHRGLDLELRQLEAQVAQEQRRPGAACQHHGATCDRPMLGDHAGHLARLRLERAHRAVLVNACPARRGRTRERRHRALRIGARVTRREQGALEAPFALAQQRIRLDRRQQPRVELVLARVRQPVFEAREVGVGLRDVSDAVLGPADVLVDLARDVLPQPQRQDDRRQFARIASLLPDPAPVARRLLAGDHALLAQHYRHAGHGEIVRGRDARDTAADDHDLTRLRQGAHGRGPGVYPFASSFMCLLRTPCAFRRTPGRTRSSSIRTAREASAPAALAAARSATTLMARR